MVEVAAVDATGAAGEDSLLEEPARLDEAADVALEDASVGAMTGALETVVQGAVTT